MTHGSLFSGIGGFDLAAQWLGWKNLFQVEIDEYCNKLLKQNFPNTKQYGDIKEFDGTEWKRKVGVLSGGFPCQPFSVSGQRKADEDERFLWSEMLRAVRQIEPPFVVAENVTGLLTIKKGILFEQVCADLENSGYEVQPFIIPACAKDAPHKRERLWFVAYSDSFRCNYEQEKIGQSLCNGKQNNPIEEQSREQQQCRFEQSSIIHSDTEGGRLEKRKTETAIQYDAECGSMQGGELGRENSWHIEPSVGRVAHGIPNRVDRIKGLGNAIVPQVAYEIFSSLDFIFREGRKKNNFIKKDD